MDTLINHESLNGSTNSNLQTWLDSEMLNNSLSYGEHREDIKSERILEYYLSVGMTSMLIHSAMLFGACVSSLIIFSKVPIEIQTPMLLYGICIGILSRFLSRYIFLGSPLHAARNICFISVPIMVFRMCVCIDHYGFKKNILQILVVAGPGLIMNAILVGILIRFFLAKNLSLMVSVIFGSACVLIHSGENIERMRILSPRVQKIAVLLEGESIVGTLVAFVIHSMFLSGRTIDLSGYRLWVFVIKYLTGGIVIGFICGKLNCLFFWKASTDFQNRLIFCLATGLIAFHLSTFIIGSSGLLAISICGFMMDCENAIFANKSEFVTRQYWRISGTIINSITFTVIGYIIGWRSVWSSQYLDYIHIVLIYCATYFGRFLIYILMAPIISRVGYGMSFPSLILAVWGGVPSLINISMTLMPQFDEETGKYIPTIFFYISGMVMMSLFVNIITMPNLLTFLNQNVGSSVKGENLRLILRYFERKRDGMVLVMKYESSMGETDWASIRAISSLVNLHMKGEKYKDTLDDREYQKDYFGFGQTASVHPTHQNPAMYEEPDETVERILRARESLQLEKFSQGFITKKSYTVLRDMTRDARDRPKHELELKPLLKMFRTQIFCKKCHQKHERICLFDQNKYQCSIRPPNYYWRRLCYHAIRSTAFSLLILGIVVHNIILIVTEMCLNPAPYANEKIAFTFFEGVFVSVYTIELLIKIAGMSSGRFFGSGCRNYCSSPFNRMDFLILITVWISFALDIACYCVEVLARFVHEKRFWFTAMKLVRVLRLLEFCVYVRVLTEMYKNKKLLIAYEVGQDFLLQEEQIRDDSLRFYEVYGFKEYVGENTVRRLEDVVENLQKIQKSHPWISITIKTRKSILILMEYMKETVESLTILGWIDTEEKMALISELDRLVLKSSKMGVVRNNDPKSLFQNVPWIAAESSIGDELFRRVDTKRYDFGDHIFRTGDVADGIYIMITGICEIRYDPNEKTIGKLHSNGELPIVDYISDKNFEVAYDNKYVLSGMCVGELSFLTGRPYASDVKAISPVEAYFLSANPLTKAMELDDDRTNGLRCRIWKNVAKNLAEAVLSEQTYTHGQGKEAAKYTLQNFSVPDLTQLRDFHIDESIQETVLIEGVVGDSATGEIYKAPLRLPRSLRDISFPDNEVEARLLFVNGATQKEI